MSFSHSQSARCFGAGCGQVSPSVGALCLAPACARSPIGADPHEVAPRVRPSNAPISGDPGMPSHARRPGLVFGRALRPNPQKEGPTPPDSSFFSRALGVWLRAGTRCCRVEAVAVVLNALGLGRKHSSCLGRCPILGVKATGWSTCWSPSWVGDHLRCLGI